LLAGLFIFCNPSKRSPDMKIEHKIFEAEVKAFDDDRL
jgi:hypothetical protein